MLHSLWPIVFASGSAVEQSIWVDLGLFDPRSIHWNQCQVQQHCSGGGWWRLGFLKVHPVPTVGHWFLKSNPEKACSPAALSFFIFRICFLTHFGWDFNLKTWLKRKGKFSNLFHGLLFWLVWFALQEKRWIETLQTCKAIPKARLRLLTSTTSGAGRCSTLRAIILSEFST